jgi:hypothetical protein
MHDQFAHVFANFRAEEFALIIELTVLKNNFDIVPDEE